MEKKCLKCGSKKVVKNGFVFGRQRYKCQDCGHQFTKDAPQGKPVSLKLLCHELYLAGLSMRQIAKIVGVTAQTVSRWMKKWHDVYMSETGKFEAVFAATKENLDDCLELRDNENMLVFSRNMPSGAKFNIVIQIPQKSLKK